MRSTAGGISNSQSQSEPESSICQGQSTSLRRCSTKSAPLGNQSSVSRRKSASKPRVRQKKAIPPKKLSKLSKTSKKEDSKQSSRGFQSSQKGSNGFSALLLLPLVCWKLLA